MVFQLVSRRYERGSVIVTSNKAFGEWGQVFGDDVLAAAILDRLLHLGEVININGPWSVFLASAATIASWQDRYPLGATGPKSPYLLVMGWPEQTSTPELLTQYAATLVELRRRGVLRTNNAPLGDYAEWLLHRALGGALADSTSAKSYDLILEDGRRVQIKARLVSEPPTRGQLQTSPFRSWDFDLAALMLFHSDSYAPALAVLAPVQILRHHARHRQHVNGDVVFIRPPLITAPGVTDITGVVVTAHAGMTPPACM